MKLFFACLVCASLFAAPGTSRAQSTEAQVDDYKGTYSIGDPHFPLAEIKVFWKDTTLSFLAAGKVGAFTYIALDSFSFAVGDNEGTVMFKRKKNGRIGGIVIYLDNAAYAGTKRRKR